MQTPSISSGEREAQRIDDNTSSSIDAINNASRQALVLIERSTSGLEQTMNQGALEVFRKTDQQITRTQRYLNRGSEQVFRSVIRGLTNLTTNLNNWASVATTHLADLGRPFQPQKQSDIQQASNTLANGVGAINKLLTDISGMAPGTNKAFSVLNAATGVISTLGEFSAEVDSGSNDYSRTMMRSTATTAQTLATSYGVATIGSTILTGAGVGAVAAAAIPATIAIAAAIGIGYLANQWIKQM